MKETHIAKIILLWVIIIGGNLVFFSQNTNKQSAFYRFGPNSELIILNFCIDTPLKYTIVTFYTIINNIIRNLNTNILRPWITHNIQDNTDEGKQRKTLLNYREAYEINTIFTIYQWIDFLIYIHVLLSQIDLFLIESSSDVLINTIIIYGWFLPNDIDTNEKTNEDKKPLLETIVGKDGFNNYHLKSIEGFNNLHNKVIL